MSSFVEGKKIVMQNDLHKMTPEELGKLFPIQLVAYDPQWKSTFQEEKECIQEALGPEIALHIEHFGSAALFLASVESSFMTG